MIGMHVLGFPRMGRNRELKWALESYWNGQSSVQHLLRTAQMLRAAAWDIQASAGCAMVTVGDFSLYDHVLDMSVRLGVVPERFGWNGGEVDLDTMFRMARGRSQPDDPKATAACAMTKWFDTNYHYIVPEFYPNQTFTLACRDLVAQVEEAVRLGYTAKVVLLGPVSYLWLGEMVSGGHRLALLPALLPIYRELLEKLAAAGAVWAQLDEPILVLDLPDAWRNALIRAYTTLRLNPLPILVASYFGPLADNLDTALALPVAGLHVDGVSDPEGLQAVARRLPSSAILSAGIIDGRNVWRADLGSILERLEPMAAALGDRLWLAPSCSLLHVPLDVTLEDHLDPEVRSWLAFAQQKLEELGVLRQALTQGPASAAEVLAECQRSLVSRRNSPRVRQPAVQRRVAAITPAMLQRVPAYPERAAAQRQALQLPVLPTTTIGSFPQTAEIRALRRDFTTGRIDQTTYEAGMKKAIAHTVAVQERLGLDVLVHGEAERNDMVEYFGEQLEGYVVTQQGWVQSYGSRCVKPPIIVGDVWRPAPMTVRWISYAQSLTTKPMKGMLTGPVTMLKWSFVRDDQPWETTAYQIALALRDEIADLEAAGVTIIQVDEPAFREALPLRHAQQEAYLRWATAAFRLATSGVAATTQIHTHMCYADFRSIIRAIAALDADVMTLEAARSQMKLLDAFARGQYPNAVGPGVYDIHSPNIPSVEEIVALLERAMAAIPVQRLWVNPDCGLKTRAWPEVEASLSHMVEAARRLRAKLAAP